MAEVKMVVCGGGGNVAVVVVCGVAVDTVKTMVLDMVD